MGKKEGLRNTLSQLYKKRQLTGKANSDTLHRSNGKQKGHLTCEIPQRYPEFVQREVFEELKVIDSDSREAGMGDDAIEYSKDLRCLLLNQPK